MPDVYRSCASVVVLRPSNVCSPDGCGNIAQILLLHKPRKNDAWQLPQGGVEEGETTEQAALRELKEEAGIDAEIVRKSGHVYQYDFPVSYRRFRPDNVCGQRIEYVFASVPPNVSVQVDKHEIDTHVWALPEELHLYIKRPEYLKLVQNLLEEGQKILFSS